MERESVHADPGMDERRTAFIGTVFIGTVFIQHRLHAD
jgi:hypothetical protein